ncbi:MAG: hypothetical protein QME13_01710, partial [Thermoanaerobacteraceae bacterium]|nr:hypothetical protein [Thermoanaerobacteraceae bacterium]
IAIRIRIRTVMPTRIVTAAGGAKLSRRQSKNAQTIVQGSSLNERQSSFVYYFQKEKSEGKGLPKAKRYF